MDKEQLLKQRYMATFADPYCKFGWGHIFLCENHHDEIKYDKMNKECNDNAFLKLKWWEARKINELPKYLVSTKWESQATVPLCESGILRRITKRCQPIYAVKEYVTTGFITESDEIKYFDLEGSLPATEEEYHEYRRIFT